MRRLNSSHGSLELFAQIISSTCAALAPSTARSDRREKRVNYLTFASLREYLLERPEGVVESSCLGLRLTLAELYAEVDFPLLGVKEEVGEYEVLVPAYM